MALKECTKKEQANSYEVIVEVDGETFEKAVEAVYKKQVKRINIQGFRKGKAPRRIIEKMYGSEVFYEDAMQDCYPEALYDASKEANIKIVKVESLEALEAGKEGFTFKAEVIVEPEIEIDNYKGIEVEKLSTEVTDELVDEEIEKVRDRNSRIVTVDDRPAQDGDTVVIDFDGYVDGEQFDGGMAENYNLVLGSNSFIPGFEEQIVGHSTDEEFSIFVTFPESYQVEELAGEEAEFKIKLHEIKTKELPEVDDEFVKDVSEKETLDEYKEELKETIAERLKDDAEKDVNDKIADSLIELVEGDIPEAMFDNQTNEMIRDFDMRLRSQGMDMKTYMEYMGMTNDSLKEAYREGAEKRVKLRLALEAIARKEGLEATEEDINAEYEKLSEAYKTDLEKVKSSIPAENLAEDIKVQKALDLVKENAVIK
ncbi:MAG: trigger factor [Ruminococcus sp.]|nr:trigger factor [Ruminococcus sp.]MEE0856200.1 trigger factor [Ruminococcus sp.]